MIFSDEVFFSCKSVYGLLHHSLLVFFLSAVLVVIVSSRYCED